jgi:hypothetical protein
MPAGGGKPVGITRKEAGFVPDQPRESADGKFIYFQQGWPRPLSIWKVPVEGGEETKILASVSLSWFWTLGKKKIYYFTKADQKGHGDLLTYDLETGETLKILTVERPVWSLAVSPDERTILFAQIDEASSDLMLVENFK